MARDIPAALNDLYQDTYLQLATCVSLARKDGVTFYFTTFDQVITLDGHDYFPLDSVQTTAMKQSADTGVDNMEIVGIISSDQITDTDLRAGRFNEAEFVIFQVNYANLGAGRLILSRGRFGEVALERGQYRVEVHMLSSIMKQKIGSITSDICRVKRLGDPQCKVIIADYTDTATVTAVVDGITLTFTSAKATDWFTKGVVKITSATDNQNIERDIKSHVNIAGIATIILHEGFPFSVNVGDAISVEAGCQRRKVDCKDKFNNLINIHCEPDLPGNNTMAQVGRPPNPNPCTT